MDKKQKTFKAEMKFSTTDIFSGGSHYVTIVERKENCLICETECFELDGIHKVINKYNVHEDENGEYIILWEYKGHSGTKYASECSKGE